MDGIGHLIGGSKMLLDNTFDYIIGAEGLSFNPSNARTIGLIWLTGHRMVMAWLMLSNNQTIDIV